MKAVFLSVVFGSVVSMNSIAAPSEGGINGGINGDLSELSCRNSLDPEGLQTTLFVLFKNLAQTSGVGTSSSVDKVIAVLHERSRYAFDDSWLRLGEVVMTRELIAKIPEDGAAIMSLKSIDRKSHVQSMVLTESIEYQDGNDYKGQQKITGKITFSAFSQVRTYHLTCAFTYR